MDEEGQKERQGRQDQNIMRALEKQCCFTCLFKEDILTCQIRKFTGVIININVWIVVLYILYLLYNISSVKKSKWGKYWKILKSVMMTIYHVNLLTDNFFLSEAASSPVLMIQWIYLYLMKLEDLINPSIPRHDVL